MSGKNILKSFGIYSKEEHTSIYPFSPVYHVDNYIAKRTQRPLLFAQRLMEYTSMLAANNVSVVAPEPYLIDPDNAAWIPRTFDLALCLLLFHNEMSSAPNRVFTTNEWALFMKGYSAYVTLTEQESMHWQQSIEHVFLDEVMWLMADVPEDWRKPTQRSLFESLVDTLFCLDNYSL